MERLGIKSLRTDGGTQQRVHIDQAIVEDYAEALAAGDVFPLVDAFYDGKDYWLADGFYRYHAHVKAGLKFISANVHKGSQRDAILFSCGANGAHGLRRTNEDKRHAVATLLQDPEWSKNSDRWIAEQAGVHHEMVGKLRPEFQVAVSATCRNGDTEKEVTETEDRHYDESESQIEPEREQTKRTGRDGKKYPAKPKAPKATKKTGRGEPAVDARKFKAFESSIGKIIRENTALKDHAGGAEFHESIRVALNGCLKTLAKWKEWAIK